MLLITARELCMHVPRGRSPWVDLSRGAGTRASDCHGFAIVIKPTHHLRATGGGPAWTRGSPHRWTVLRRAENLIIPKALLRFSKRFEANRSTLGRLRLGVGEGAGKVAGKVSVARVILEAMSY